MLPRKSALGTEATATIMLIASVIIAGINGFFFTTGYWLNADDVMFLQFALEGPRAILDAMHLYSQYQGRIGQYILLALNILGAGMADKVLFRILYVAAFFLQIFLFMKWFETVSRLRIATIAFLLAAALTPLHFYHLPPTSFPLQNTVPFTLLITARLALLAARKGRGPGWTPAWALPLTWLAMLATEYAFLLGSGMLAIEYLFQLSRSGNVRDAISVFRSRFFLQDLALCIIPLAIYLAWRSWHPSAYDGNSLDGFANPRLALSVWWHHAFGLNTIVIPQGIAVFGSTGERLWPPLLAGLLAGLAIYKSAPGLAQIRRPLLPALLAVSFAFYVTFPTSMTEKQQQWCAEFGSCIFLDSRTAFPASIIALTLIAAFLFSASRKLPSLEIPLRLGIALIAAGGTMITLSHNAWMKDHMQVRMAVWEHANEIACGIDLDMENIRETVDPQGLIAIHPHLDPEHFWRIYLRKAAENCTTAH